MVTVSIIGLLTAVAIPAFAKARRNVRVNRMTNDLRIVHDAFNMYAMEAGQLPDAFGTVPKPVAEYLANAQWNEPTVMGGRWLYYGFMGLNFILIDDLRGERGTHPLAPAEAWLAVDRKVDDGDLTRGNFRSFSEVQMLYNISGKPWQW